AYNKDMQEDKEAIFDAVDTVKMCLEVFIPMIATMKAIPENMYKAAGQGFINATDLADYLVRKGMPFRSAYKVVGQTVALCIKKGVVLDELAMDEYKAQSELFEEDLYEEISLETCVKKRISEGSTGPASVEKQIACFKEKIKELKA
ncbi:MAG: argininosuccinate lyase, partial [Clostridia bacterium]|nr:argininosuccinate lyase [Clostridia bacterium]